MIEYKFVHVKPQTHPVDLHRQADVARLKDARTLWRRHPAVSRPLQIWALAARQQPRDALRHARDVLTDVGALEINSEYHRWAWPLAARSAQELGDDAAIGELLGLLDAHQPGHLGPMLRAERDLVRARLAAQNGDQSAGSAFAAAIGGLRELSTPYHLAHGLLDQAEYLLPRGDAEAAGTAIEEARGIASRLRCQPLLDRADAIEHATSLTRGSVALGSTTDRSG
jgi:hypothetical protein